MEYCVTLGDPHRLSLWMWNQNRQLLLGPNHQATRRPLVMKEVPQSVNENEQLVKVQNKQSQKKERVP